MFRLNLKSALIIAGLAMGILLPAGRASAGEDQWVEVTIVAKGVDLEIKAAPLKWGKYYDASTAVAAKAKAELDAVKQVNGMKIESGKTFILGASGRLDAASGTEGAFEIWSGGKLVGTYSWDAPYGATSNKSDFAEANEALFEVNFKNSKNINKASGTIERVSIKIEKNK